MAYSISASMEFSVHSTICSTIGSTSRAAAGSDSFAIAEWGSLNAFRFRLRGTNDQDAVRVDFEVLSRKDHGGRTEFLHDRRPVEPKPRRQHRALVDRRVAECAVEVDRTDRFARRRRGAARGELGYIRPFDQP